MLPLHLNVALMLAGYLLVMGYLALGLRLLRRRRARPGGQPRPSGVDRAGPRVPLAARHGWPGLVRRVVGTMTAGYLLLLAVVGGYYYGVVRVASGRVMASAITGPASLLAIALPVWLLASWLAENRSRIRGLRGKGGTGRSDG